MSEAPLLTRQRAWFDEFWEAVWLKVGKEETWVKFKVRVRDEATFSRVMAGVRRDAPAQSKKERQYQVTPRTWVNGKRWEDEAASTPSLFQTEPTYRTVDEVLAEQRKRDAILQAEWEAKQTDNA